MVLDCPEISEALRNPPGDLLSDTALESYGAATARCVERLQAEGVDLTGYTMTETIDDMEAAREALGYERINLLGTSYGTRLAMIYGWLYPDSLHRVIMLEVNTPGHFVWEPEILDAQIEDYAGKGKWLAVMYWASDCHVCNVEVGNYADFHERHREACSRAR